MRQIEELYIPPDERTLRRVQRRADDLENSARTWARSVIEVLPRGLPLLHPEIAILSYFLTQQRRLNLEMDARRPELTVRSRLGRVLTFINDGQEDIELIRAVHDIVATKVDGDIDRAVGVFCNDQGIPPVSDPAIDWRVALRYLAQGAHRIAGRIDLKKDFASSPQRFELALHARDAAADVAAKRAAMFTAFRKEAI